MIAFSPSQADRSFHGLWSLWDIMRQVNIAQFVGYGAIGGVAAMGVQFQRDPSPGETATDILEGNTLSAYGLTYRTLEDECISLELTASRSTVKKILDVLKQPNPTHSMLRPLQIELQGRLFDETGSKLFVALNMREADFYNNPFKGWEEVLARFPHIFCDVEEASKCLALSRPTACVFHMMRCMEIVLRAVARCLGIPDPTKPAERNWGAILRELKRAIDGKNASASWTKRDDGQFFEDAYVSIDAVRNAWRNTTMHIERTYTEADAEDVWRAVKALMKKLASRCDENGDPKA